MTTATPLSRPKTDEYAPYYGLYIDQVPEGDVLDLLECQVADTVRLLLPLTDAQAEYRYAPGKWSVKEVVGHLIDTERVFALRAVHFARRDPAPLPSFEQDGYVEHGFFDQRALSSLLDEYAALRRANVLTFRGILPEAWGLRGIASGLTFTARTFPFIIAGHELHHRRVLHERYLSTF